MQNLTDIELLDEYGSRRSEEAFRELVARHVDFIYSAALRQLRNPHLAQEATQSAFIALAGKAGRLRRQTVIAGWLHRAVHFAALKLQRSEARRKHWEEEAAAAMNVPGESEPGFPEQALPQVDGALAELGESDRDAIILRFIQQQSLRDVAQALGTSEDAAKKRVSRALERLRGLLVRRGVAISAAVLATGLSQMPVTAAPAALPSTLAALAANAAVPTVTTTATLLVLMASTKSKLAAAAGLAVLAALTVLLWPQRPASSAAVSTNTVQTNIAVASAMKIRLTSVMVNDQDRALKFYTEVLGFIKKRDFPAGAGRWLTVVSPAEPDGTELLLEPMGFAPARTFQAALFRARIPITAFVADDVQREYDRMMKLGVKFTSPPVKAEGTTLATFEDTCGNRIQIFQPPGVSNTVTPAIKLGLTSVMVAEQDQDRALKFYTEILGFVKKMDMPAGGGRWITVVSPDEPDGTELLLEPIGFAFARTYQRELHDAGIPYTSFMVANVEQQYERLVKLGVAFPTRPTRTGPTTIAVLDDTCGNLIQIFQP
jgi:RNA polymerase sigma factor (sigma-70 family)